MTELTVKEKQELQRREHANGLIAILTDADKAKEFERSLSIKKIVENALPISVIKNYSGMVGVKQAIDIQLTKLVASLNLKWNLNDNQIAQIVEDVVDKYPNETIEDFVLVFRRARMGEFGELFRLDGPVIFGWVNVYLEEKYRVIEDKLLNEKDEFYKVKPVKSEDEEVDWLKKWKDSVDSIEIKKVPPLLDKDIRKEGKEHPKTPKYVPPDENYIKQMDLNLKWMRECFDPLTGKPNDHYLPKDKWIELNPIK